MPEKLLVEVEPQLLVWARERRGFAVEDAAKKAGLSVEKLIAAERGNPTLTFPQLRKVAEVYKRPLALFFLPSPPDDEEELPDFRLGPGVFHKPLSPELLLCVRHVIDMRQAAIEASDVGDVPSCPVYRTLRLNMQPEAAAAQLRVALGVPFQTQRGWRDEYEALRNWKDATENLGVMVFQVQKIAPAEMRGFSIAEKPLPAVALNAKDAPSARSFTLIHELTHVALGRSGICDFEDLDSKAGGDTRLVEAFCNAVAGNFLVPTNELLSCEGVKRHDSSVEWTDPEMSGIARFFKVSRHVILRRLFDLNRTTLTFLRKAYARWASQIPPPKDDEDEFVEAAHRRVMRLHGSLYVRLLLEAYHAERITGSDLADYLSVKLQHLPAIENAAIERKES